MDGPSSHSTASPRRRREHRDAGNAYATNTMRRTASNISSTSSDILVGAHTGPSHNPDDEGDYLLSQLSTHSTSPPTTASIANGRHLTIRFGPALARDRFRGIFRTKPKPLSRASNASPLAHVKHENGIAGEGPNHRGTYSKEYTLKHPEVNWIHRGQGRYLPASEVKIGDSGTAERSGRQTSERTTGSVAMSEQTMQRMLDALTSHFDDYRKEGNPFAKPNWSPSFRSQYNQIVDLIRRTPRQQWSKLPERIGDAGFREVVRKWNKAMERQFPTDGTKENQRDESEDRNTRTRPSRQVRSAFHSIEHRRSQRISDAPESSYYEDEEEAAEESDDFVDPDQTYNKAYVEAHPNEKFYHTGNGYYKRGSRTADPDVSFTRRESTNSQSLKKSISNTSQELDPEATLRFDDLPSYPGSIFHHKGNGWYKPGVAPNGRRGSYLVALDGEITRFDGDPDALVEYNTDPLEDEDTLTLQNPNVMVDRAFTQRHPEIRWVHRGQGRYKTHSSVFGTEPPAATNAASDRRSSRADNSFTSFDKDYPASHVSEESRRTSGRRRSSKAFLDIPETTEMGELFDKAYVDAHLDEKFHHRGQGRYARGVRPPKPPSSQGPVVEEPVDEGLVDTTYVNNHPNEVFHHRGQGKWARGLPPPGSSNKMAIRGPGTKDMKADATKTGEENEFGEKPPPISALLKKEDGPARWPHLTWVYRGGGKWCRQSKEDAQRLVEAQSGHKKPRLSSGRARADGPEAQLQREALAAEGGGLGSRKPAGLFPKPAKLARQRSQLSGIADSKASSHSQSKAPTPRPPLLPPEEDRVTEEDLPSLYKDEWSDDEEEVLDEAAKIMRARYLPLTGADAFVKALTKHDPAVRSIDSLKQIAANAQAALKAYQDEYLALDVIVAENPMHGKKVRKPVKGGRQAVEHQVWEDKKEAMLYDYNFDPRKVGFQDPIAQQIQRDEEGRELRRRRRNDPHATAVDYGDGEMTSKRAVKPVSRFDGVVLEPPRKRSRLATSKAEENLLNGTLDKTPTGTPDRSNTPNPSFTTAADYQAPARGRWANHIPKRIRELRGESVGSARSGSSEAASSSNTNNLKNAPSPAPGSGVGIRKGRPPGSKNLHKRKDAGIKKGPRKPKIPSSEPMVGGAMEMETDMEEGSPSASTLADATIPAIVENPPDDMPAAAAPDVPLSVDRAAERAFSLIQ